MGKKHGFKLATLPMLRSFKATGGGKSLLQLVYEFINDSDPKTLDIINELEPVENASGMAEIDTGISDLKQEVARVRNTLDDTADDAHSGDEAEEKDDHYGKVMRAFVEMAEKMVAELRERLETVQKT